MGLRGEELAPCGQGRGYTVFYKTLYFREEDVVKAFDSGMSYPGGS